VKKILRAFLAGVAAAAVLLPAPARADSKVSLSCAGRFRTVIDAVIELHDDPPHVLNISFQGSLPPRSTLDWVLHDCLSTAVKLDGKRDIVVHAWHYASRTSAPKALELYSGQQLVYRAARRKVMLADPGPVAERKP
jgi:hypothetical protein